MKGHSGWSYRPYCPPMWEAGDPYICRIVPSETSIHVEWLDCGADQYEVYYRRKGALEFCFWGLCSEPPATSPDCERTQIMSFM